VRKNDCFKKEGVRLGQLQKKGPGRQEEKMSATLTFVGTTKKKRKVR